MKSHTESQASTFPYRCIWLVGASSGIGEALVKQFQSLSVKLYISARNGDALNTLAKVSNNIIPLPLDITDELAVVTAAQQIQKDSGKLDLIILNAGTCEYIDSYDVELDVVRRVMETNFFAALQVLKHALPLLRANRSLTASHTHATKVVFVSSSVTYQSLPRAGAYGSSKAALRYFAECFKSDIEKEGISIQLISPGFVKTPLTDKNDFDMPFMISADNAAKRIIKGIQSTTFDIHFPKRFTWILKLMSLMPDALRFKMVSKLSRHDTASVPHSKPS